MFGEKPILQTSHIRILRFYEQNPTLDFEQINLLLIDFLEHVGINMKQDMTEPNISLQLLHFMKYHQEEIKDMKTSLTDLKQYVTKIQMDITNTLWLQFLEIKREYVDEFKQIIINTQSNSTMDVLLEEHNQKLIEKTTQIIQDIIPKSQHHYNETIEASIQAFQTSIMDETRQLLKQSVFIDNNNQHIHEFVHTFEEKSKEMFQNLQQPIYSYISSSEERIHSNLANIRDLSIKTQEKHTKELKDILEKSYSMESKENKKPYENGSYTYHGSGGNGGSFSTPLHRTQIHILLNRMFSTSEIIKIPRIHVTNTMNTVTSLSTQIYAIKRPNLPSIMIESKQGETNVETTDIHMFIEQMKSQQMNGILVSQYSGITSKPNYYIECHDKYLMVYVHQMEFNPDKLKVAIDIIDQMTLKIKQYQSMIPSVEDQNHVNEWIEKDVLDEINKEYQLFVSQKNAIIQNLRENQRKVISQIEEFQFPSLDRYLSSKYTAPMPKNGHRCDLCKNFNANNLKALAAHKRGCARKIGNIATIIPEILENVISENI
jgi:hypothetical protein